MMVQFSVFALTWDIFHLPQRLAVSVSYITAVTFHFLSNRLFTFQAGNANVLKQLVKYLMVTLINYLITIVVVDTCVKILYLSPYIGVMASIAMTVLIGFLLMKFWVFNDTSKIGKEEQSIEQSEMIDTAHD